MDALLGVVVRSVVWLVSLLPLDQSRRFLGRLSALQLALNSRAAQTTRTNLALCFPELNSRQLRGLARDSLAQTACIFAESGMLFHWSRQRWLALAKQHQTEPLRQALASGRGVLVLVPHFGNWEYLALYLGQFGALGLYEKPRIKSLEAPLIKARERSGMTMLPLDGAGLRSALRQLQDGGCLAMLPDQVPRRTSGVYAPFFGSPALTPSFAHRLIQRTSPVVLLGVARRIPSGFDVSFTAMGEDLAAGIYADSAEGYATALNQAIETVVREDPSQYQWEYKRFRRQPVGSADPYGEWNG
jgi:KDO2-lipid IV(A) lauroyltransferase